MHAVRWGLNWLLFGILACSLGVMLRYQQIRQHKPASQLAALVPSKVGNLTAQELLLGPTEGVDNEAREKMEYDEVVHRSYAGSKGTFSIYVGFWQAGRRPPSFVAAHTPDRCWVMAGMRCQETRSHYELVSANGRMPGGEWRIFAGPANDRFHVVFWHVVGGRLYQPISMEASYLRRSLRAVSEMFIPQRDQYFVRIVSRQPFEDYATDDVFDGAIQKLSGIASPELGPDRPRALLPQ